MKVEGAGAASPRHSGGLERHYAPQTPLELVRAGTLTAAEAAAHALAVLEAGTRVQEIRVAEATVAAMPTAAAAKTMSGRRMTFASSGS